MQEAERAELRTYAVHLHEHARQIEDNVAAWRSRTAPATA